MPRRRGEAVLPSLEEIFKHAAETKKKQLQLVEIKYLKAQNLGLYPQASIDHWLDIAATEGYTSHIILHRNNGLRRIVSHLIGQKTGVYVLKQEAEPNATPPQVKIHLNCEEINEGFARHPLLHWLGAYEQSHQELLSKLKIWCTEKGNRDPLMLFYEEDIERSPLRGYQRVCDYLSLTLETPSVSLKRINDRPLVDIIENYEEVDIHLRGTEFAWMLNENG